MSRNSKVKVASAETLNLRPAIVRMGFVLAILTALTAFAVRAGAQTMALMPQGPRKVGILGLKAKILAAQGKDRAPVLREQLALVKSLPATQRNPETQQKLEKELAALEAAPHAQR